MIVEPDFLQHWKTRLLIRMLDYEAAPLCVLSLWAHCQQRKTDRLEVDVPTFCSICGYPFRGPDEADKFYECMMAAGFTTLADDGAILVHDFAKTNAQLFANWKNGLRGGRPSETQTKPTVNPNVTQSENGVTDRLDKIDKSRVEKKDKKDIGANESHPPAAKLSEEEWRQNLVSEPAYKHINVSAEFSKLQRWCEVNHKQPTRRRFVNWLNRIEPPFRAMPGSTTTRRGEPAPITRPADLTDEQIAKNKAVIGPLVANLAAQLKPKDQETTQTT